MRCRNCGSENDDNLYICSNCGSPLYDEQEEITETEIKTFPSKDLKIDPFWLDLYMDKPKPRKKLR